MANVLLGVTGSVAAVRTPVLYSALTSAGHHVRVVATNPSLYFFDPSELDPTRPGRNPAVVSLDADEWPGRDQGRQYRRDDPVLHIELRRWADLFLIAPLDANTLAKLANGLCDNCLTCVWRAWDPERPAVLAPAMNTLMWQHPLTARHFRLLASLGAPGPVPELADAGPVIDWINAHSPRLRVIPPVTKQLACGDVGPGAMAEVDAIVAIVAAFSGNPLLPGPHRPD
jgi:phosphopantothenoylcysteine decarboxylase